jgi:hypothetical protein
MGRCYNEHVDYDLESLGDDAWLTGCPLCGDQCWSKGNRQERERIDAELNGLLDDEH